MLSEYLQPDSTKEVSNRDIVSINDLASKYLEIHNKTEHPIVELYGAPTLLIGFPFNRWHIPIDGVAVAIWKSTTTLAQIVLLSNR